MSILLISPYFSPMIGGVETHLDDLCNFFNRKKIKVNVRTYKAFGVKDRGKSYEKKAFIYIHRIWWPDFNLIFLFERFQSIKFIYLFLGLFIDCLFFILKNYKSINVIQAHGFIAAFIAVILGKIFNIHVVVNTHVGFNLSNNFTTTIIKWVLFRADKILVLTKGIQISLVKLGIPKEKIIIYHYWVDQKKFNIQKRAKQILGWTNKKIVLFVGRLIETKGVWILFDLARRFNKITYILIGSGPLEDKLREKANNFPNVVYLGKVENNKLPLYYNAADIVLIPSKTINQEYEEGIPRVMIEALSCGVPIIATKVGGIPDMHSNEVGLLVDDNCKSIARAINKIFNLRFKRQQIRSFALRLYSLKNAEIITGTLYE